MKPAPAAASLVLAALLATLLGGAVAHADVGPPVPPVPPVPPSPPALPVDAERGEAQGSVQVNIGTDRDDDDPVELINRLPPEVRVQLTGDQIENIIRREQDDRVASSASEVLVPGFFFATILGIVGLLQFARFRRERQLHETLRLMIEEGVEIPPALLVPDKPKPNDRRRGIILVMVGLGLMAFLGAAEDDGSWAFGLVPLCLGVGYLAAWSLERAEQGSSGPSSSP